MCLGEDFGAGSPLRDDIDRTEKLLRLGEAELRRHKARAYMAYGPGDISDWREQDEAKKEYDAALADLEEP